MMYICNVPIKPRYFTYMINSLDNTTEILELVKASNVTFSIENFEHIINLVNPLKGCSFMSIRNYSNDASEGTEVADYLININGNYANVLAKQQKLMGDFALDYITNGIDSEAYKTFVVAANAYNFGKHINANELSAEGLLTNFDTCLTAKLYPTLKKDGTPYAAKVDNYLKIGKILSYNTSTKNAGIFGLLVKKTVIVKGTYKPTSTKIETLTKNIIDNCVGATMQDIRRFNLGKMTAIKAMGETVECYHSENN